MIDLHAVRRMLAQKRVITVSRSWLEEVERDLTELARMRAAGTAPSTNPAATTAGKSLS